MASTTTLKYGPKISLSHVTMKGGGGPDPFIVKDYENGPFFFAALPNVLYNAKFHISALVTGTNGLIHMRHIIHHSSSPSHSLHIPFKERRVISEILRVISEIL